MRRKTFFEEFFKLNETKLKYEVVKVKKVKVKKKQKRTNARIRKERIIREI